MDKHPDFIVTIDGKDVTKDCLRWHLKDADDSMCSLMVVVDNKDLKYDGAFSVDGTVSIRFGHWRTLNQKVELTIKKYKEWHSGQGRTITVIGLDATHKLSQKTGRGHHKTDKPKKIIEEVAQETGTQIDQSKVKNPGGTSSPTVGGCKRGPWPAGRHCGEQMQEALNRAEPQKDSGGDASKVYGKDSGGGSGLTGNRQATSGLKPETPGEKSRMNNANKRAQSSAYTGTLNLVGYPLLRAKKGITIEGVGSQGSGKWYVKSVDHDWGSKSGYITDAQVIRGGTGKDAGNAPQPMVYYGDIYKGKDNIYAGPRPTDAESQATLTFGDGEYTMTFNWQVDGQTGRDTGKKAEGKALNPNKVKKPIEEVTSQKQDDNKGKTDPKDSSPTVFGPKK